MTSGIEWTEDTWNPLTGCSIASAGCTNCYAAREAAGRLSGHPAYKGLAVRNATTGVAEFTGEVRQLPDRLTEPLRWRRPRLVFVNSMSDLFHPAVPSRYIAQVYATMAVANAHTFQVLTKRPKRRRLLLADLTFQTLVAEAATALLASSPRGGWAACPVAREWVWPLPNVWEGVSVEDADNAWRLNDLARTDAAVRWVSAEPLLGELQLPAWLDAGWKGSLDWVVVGGESGPGARPMHPDWVRSLRDQCAMSGVAFLFKQWGEWGPAGYEGATHLMNSFTGNVVDRAGATSLDSVGDGRRYDLVDRGHPGWERIAKVGKKAAGRLLDGVQHDGYPQRVSA